MKRSLESGFQAAEIFPLNCQQPLSRLPLPILDVSGGNASMHGTLIRHLKENQASGGGKKQSRGKKVAKPGELLYSEKYTGPSNETDQQPCGSKSSGSEHSEVNKEDF